MSDTLDRNRDAEVRLMALLEGLGLAVPTFWANSSPELLREIGAAIARQAARAKADPL